MDMIETGQVQSFPYIKPLILLLRRKTRDELRKARYELTQPLLLSAEHAGTSFLVLPKQLADPYHHNPERDWMLVAMKIELESKEMQIDRGDDSGGEVYSILSRFLPQIVDMKWDRKKRDDTGRGGRTHASSLHESIIIKTWNTEWTACLIFAR